MVIRKAFSVNRFVPVCACVLRAFGLLSGSSVDKFVRSALAAGMGQSRAYWPTTRVICGRQRLCTTSRTGADESARHTFEELEGGQLHSSFLPAQFLHFFRCRYLRTQSPFVSL